MKHCTEKELLNFSREKTPSVEKHLKECSSCFLKYNFLSMKFRLNSYIEYEKVRLKDKSQECLSEEELFLYASGKSSGNKRNKIQEHLICCEKCASLYFDIRPVNIKSLWLSIEEAVSLSIDFIKGISLVPDLAVSREMVREKPDTVKAFIGDEVKLDIPVDKDGYLTVIHWNGETISLLFPNIYEKDTSVKAKTVKTLKGRIDPPATIQQIKVFITEDKILRQEDVNFNDVNSVLRNLEGFIKKLDDLDEKVWSEKVITYEVMEFKGRKK